MPTVWGGGGGGAVLVVDGLGAGMVESAGFEVQAVQLLPHGEAWPRRPSSTLRKVTRGLARTFARLDADIEALEREIHPALADESLPAWEAFAGLPHSCTGDPPTSLEDRRAAVVAKLSRARGVLTRPRARAVGSELGYSITFLRTYLPTKCGSKCGSKLRGTIGGWPWHVVVVATPSIPALNGTLVCLLKAAIIEPMIVTVLVE